MVKELSTLKWILRVLALIPLATGALDFTLGAQAQSLMGAQLSAQTLSDAVLNSQIRFFGACWFGLGVLLLVALADMQSRAWLVRLVMLIIFAGGVGRAISAVQFGLPSAPLIGATVLELLGMPLLLGWYTRLTQSQTRSKQT